MNALDEFSRIARAQWNKSQGKHGWKFLVVLLVVLLLVALLIIGVFKALKWILRAFIPKGVPWSMYYPKGR